MKLTRGYTFLQNFMTSSSLQGDHFELTYSANQYITPAIGHDLLDISLNYSKLAIFAIKAYVGKNKINPAKQLPPMPS